MFSNEIISLVQNIELNKAGWKDKTIQRLITATVWFSGPLNRESIQTFLNSNFHLPLGAGELEQLLSTMLSQKLLLKLSNDTYKIPDQQLVVLEKEIKESENAEKNAKDFFCKLVIDMDKDIDANNLWNNFKNEFLDPHIKQIGANAYHFIAGKMISIDDELQIKFLNKFSNEKRLKLKRLIAAYIDPRNPYVRSYFSRMLHANFCIDACGLSKDVLNKLNANTTRSIQFKIFVDTNFLFSLLDLHENPSNASAQELRKILKQLKGNPHIILYITPETIEEAKTSIIYAEQQWHNVPLSKNFVDVALQSNISGLAQRFLLEKQRKGLCFTIEDWFKPYITDFVPLAKSKGIEIYNEKHNEYSTRQDIIEDINIIMESEKRLPENRRKSYEKVAHDMILWHYICDKRPPYMESPIDAIYYIMTVDFRLIHFDKTMQKNNHSKVPLCIHPATFIQLLQFWIPRTKEFEEAMLGSLCLPFIFQDLDYQAEKLTLKILNGIGRFDGSDKFPEETIKKVLFNEGLRSRLQTIHSNDEETQLIKDALITEMKILADEEKKRAEYSEEKLRKQGEQINELSIQNLEIINKYEQEKKRRDEEENSKKSIIDTYENEIREMNITVKKLENSGIKLENKVKKIQLFKCGGIYIGCIIVIILASFIGGFFFNNISSKLLSTKILSQSANVFVSLVIFILLHLLLEIFIGKKQIFSELLPFKLIIRFRNWLWCTVIIGILLGIISTLCTTEIQNKLSENKSDNFKNPQSIENNIQRWPPTSSSSQ
ncbi:MAG: hypothetical protein LBR10_06660 [Prevotellaceae bacterium]|jgi:hypothetical protein|nr:hypothetical protein [Prevotellaceae bacterium]